MRADSRYRHFAGAGSVDRIRTASTPQRAPVVSHQRTRPPPPAGLVTSPIRTFLPFDQPDSDFYSFEVSDLEVYNLGIDTFGATVGIGQGEGNDDVLEIEGMSEGSFGLATPKRIGFEGRASVRATVGVKTNGNTPILDGILPGETFGGVQINDKNTNPPTFVIGAAFPTETGTTVVGSTEKGTFPNQVVLPGVFAVELRVTKGTDEVDGQPGNATGVGVRPAGSNESFIIVGDTFEPFDSEGSDAVFPNTTGFGATFGADNLGPGGTMFIDDVFTTNLRDPTGIPITDLINQAFDDEIEAFVKLSQDPTGAARLIEVAMGKVTQAQQQLSQGQFQPGTRSPDALIELNKAKQLDQEALDAIAAGDLTTASQKLIDASTAKARADLFLEGHNPQPGPFPDGLGGFDTGDPTFADGFQSGDVNAWSTGEPTNRRTSSDDTSDPN